MEYITKTNAIQEYFLSSEDLSQLNGVEKRNPHGRKYPMTLYAKDEIMELLKYKYNTHSIEIVEEKLLELKKNKESRKQSRRNAIIEKRNKRKEQLTFELQKVGLHLREDSKLCQRFIDGSIKDKSIPWIVHRMCQVKYLYDYCHMKDRLREFKHTHGYIYFEEMEDIILQEIGGYPNVFPWIHS